MAKNNVRSERNLLASSSDSPLAPDSEERGSDCSPPGDADEPGSHSVEARAEGSDEHSLAPPPLDSELLDWQRELAGVGEAEESAWIEEAMGRLRQCAPGDLVGRQWAPGDLLGGRYRLGEKLGSGGFGVVYRARDEALNRDVAVKLLHSTYSVLSKYQQRFEQEARIASQIASDHVVSVHTVERGDDGSFYLVMELIEGGPLDAFLGNLADNPRTICELILQAALGLSAAHRQGIVHRDIKCSNLLVDVAGRLKLTDFGLARIVERDADADDATFTEQFAGTIPYMSPEQIATPGRVDRRTDIYSLGVVLYELLADSRPFRGTPTAVMRQIAETDPTPLRQLNPSCPRDLALIAEKCLRKEPSRRYDSADDLADDLRRSMDDRPVRARPIGQIERGRRWCRRNPVIASLCGALMIAAFALAALNVNLSAERRRLARALNLSDQLLEGLERQEFKNIDDVYARVIRGHKGLTQSEQLALRELLTAVVDLQDACADADNQPSAASPRADFTESLGKSKWVANVWDVRRLRAGLKVHNAVNRLNRVIELDDTLGIAWLMRAQVRQQILGEPSEEVLPDWNRAVELLPSASAAYSGRGWCYLQMERCEEAVDDFKQAKKIDAANELSHLGLGIAMEIQGRFEDAIPHYETAMRLPPKYMMDPAWKLRVASEASTAYWGASNERFRAGDYDGAVRDALRALEFSPPDQRLQLWPNLLLMTTEGEFADFEALQSEVDNLHPISSDDRFVFAKDFSNAIVLARIGLLKEQAVLQLVDRIEADPGVASELNEKYLAILREGIESGKFPQANKASLRKLLKALESD